jgi:hypothetical protein
MLSILLVKSIISKFKIGLNKNKKLILSKIVKKNKHTL